MKPFISLANISKTFYGVKALDNLALTLLLEKFTVWLGRTAAENRP